MGGVWKKEGGVENLTNDTPPKNGFCTPPSYGTFSTPLRCQCPVFPVQKSTTEQTRSSFGGVQTFSGERVLWYVFLPPYVFREGANREKLTVKKIINSEMFFFSPFMSLINREKLCVSRDKIGTKNPGPAFFHC